MADPSNVPVPVALVRAISDHLASDPHYQRITAILAGLQHAVSDHQMTLSRPDGEPKADA